jgi:hypothetical protein
MALNMILIEGGAGMCPDWGQMLHIHPRQHSSDGTITKALQGLTALQQLAKNSGINDPLINWLE